MKDNVKRFADLERRIVKEKGEFSFFALFLREDAPDKWDLVVAAPWMDNDRGKAHGYLAEQIKRGLAPAELTRLSRVVILDPGSPELRAINRAMKVSPSDGVEVQNSDFFGLQIKHAYIITSQQLPATSESVMAT